MSFTLKISDRFRVRKIEFFNEFSLELKYDSIASGFALSFFFDPNNAEHKELAAVTHYHEVEVGFNDELLITGNVLNTRFIHDSKTNLCVISGHSKTGVLTRCQIPTTLYPLQSDGLSLKQIANKLIAPFKIDMVVDSSVSSKMNKVFKRSTAEQTQSIADYLVTLARQKDIVITHDEKGRLLFTSANTNGVPILDFDGSKEMRVGTKFELNHNGEGMHSSITVMKQASASGGNAGQQTIKNPYVIQSFFSPSVKSQTSGDDNDTISAAQRELSNELKGLTLTIDTDRWVVDGKIIRPNNTISIIDPNLYLYGKTKWFIESVSYTGNNIQTTAVLNCVIPEVYSGKTPVSFFDGINLTA